MDTFSRDQRTGSAAIVRGATVRIGGAENGGTGFFIAPYKILTCAHVVEDIESASLPLTITSLDGNTSGAKLVKSWREEGFDLAMLDCDQIDLPALHLQLEYEPGTKVFAYGYPSGEYRIGGDSAHLMVEGPYGELGDHIRLKDSSIEPGFSGAPILSPETLGVIGMITKTRDTELPHGARAIASTAIMRACSPLIDLPPRQMRNTSLPPAYGIPYQHIECIGRSETIDEMTRELVSGRTCLLFGMPGIGKSLVAAKVAESTQQEIQGSRVLWIDAESADSPSQMVDHLAESLHLAIPYGMSLPNRERYVRQVLSNTSNLIIVLDELQNNDIAANTIPRCIPGSVRVIATSQRKLAIFKTRRQLHPLTPKAAYDLFISQLDRPLTAADEALVEEICARVGYHPLAVRLLGSKVDSEQLPLANLRDRLNDEISTWEIARSADRAESATLHASIAAATSALDEDSFRLLSQVAFLPKLISGDIALKAFAELSDASGQDLLGELVSRSLLLRDGELIRQNILIRGYCQAAAGEGHPTYHQASVKAVSTHLLDTPMENSGALVRELAAYVISEPWPLGTLDSPSQLIQNLALLTLVDDYSPLSRGGNVTLQTRAASSLMAKSTQLGGEFEFAAQLAVASFYSRTGHVDEALSILQSLQKNRDGTESADLASVLISLGNTAMVAGASEYACQSFASARRIAQSLSNDALTASSSGQLGRLSLQLGLQAPAIALYRQALALYEQLQFNEGISAASYHLGSIANQIGDQEQARTHLQTSLSLDESSGDVTGQLMILHELGKVSEVDRDFLDSKFAALRDRLLDQQNWEGLGRTYLAWADTLLEKCKDKDGLKGLIPIYKKALEFAQRADNLLGIAQIKGQLGLASYWMQDLDLAAQYTEDCLDGYRQIRSEQGFSLGLVQLAAIRIAQGHTRDAIGLLEASLDFLTRNRSSLLISAGSALHQLVTQGESDVTLLAPPWMSTEDDRGKPRANNSPSVTGVDEYERTFPPLKHLAMAVHHLAPAAIPIEGLAASLQEIAQSLSRDDIDTAITFLIEHHVVNTDESGRCITSNLSRPYPLPIEEDPRDEGLLLAIDILSYLHPLRSIPDRIKISTDTAHNLSLRLCAVADWRGLASRRSGSLLNNAAITLMNSGRIADAYLCLDTAVGYEKNVIDSDDDSEQLALLNNYATVNNRLELYDFAKEVFEEALNAIKIVDYVNGDAVGKLVSNLGHLLVDTEDYDGAWENFRSALLIHERVNGLVDPSTAVDLCNLGLVKSLKMNATSAVVLFKRSLNVWAACGMEDTRNAAEVMIQMSGPMYGLGRHAESEQMLIKAIDILRRDESPNSLTLVRAYNNLGLYYQNIGEKALARDHLLHALAISDMFYGSRSALSRNLRKDLKNTEEP